MSGSFFYMHMTERIPFGKHYTEEQNLITLLQSRGLSITDVNKANHYLTHIGYYRLSAYMYPLLRVPKEQHIYKPGIVEKKKRWGGLYPPHLRASEIIFAVKRRKDLPPQQPMHFASLDFIPLIRLG